MAITLKTNSTFIITCTQITNGEEVSLGVQEEIIDKVKKEEYVVSMTDKTIREVKSLKVLYGFIITSTTTLDYDMEQYIDAYF